MGWAASTKENVLLSVFQSRISADGGSVEDVPCLSLDLDLLLSESSSFTTGLLEFYPGAAAAYSLRQLRRSVSPYAIRVRKSDDTEQDIGFGSNGELDTNALLDFADGGDAWVSKWYDQSSNGNDASQITPGSQPQIVSSGSLVTENGKPALQFDGSADFMDLTGFTNAASDYSFFSVVKSDTGTGSPFVFDSQSGRLIFYPTSTSGTLGVYYDGAWQGTDFTHRTQAVTSIHAIAPSSGSSYLNGVATNTGLSYTQQAIGGTVRFGRNSVGSANLWDGTMQEIVIYASDETSNRTGIETNINDFYSIYS